MKNSSTQVAELIFPVHGCRDALRRKGIEPENYHKKNLSYIKSLKNIKRPEKPATRPQSIPKSSTNYIKENITIAKTLRIPKFEQEAESFSLQSLGKVPEYLSSIKKELADTKKAQ